LEVVLVVDGSFLVEDWVVARLAARCAVVVVCQMNRGLGAARNFGVSQCGGRFVFPLDADNVADPGFVARCVEVLRRRPGVAYVTSWSEYLGVDGSRRVGGDVGYEPLGNWSGFVGEENVAGDAAAVVPRWVFDQGFGYSEELTSLEDWHFYRELHEAGRFGVVIPERLLGYRVREDSMQAQIVGPYRGRLVGEIDARIRENATQWTSSNGSR
jgi:glycosyltransferase involved in cell wall biosynthesis